MKTSNDILWTRFAPDKAVDIDEREWRRHGGKWIVFDDRKTIDALAAGLVPFIDSGEIAAAKMWNGEASAINVYSLDRDRGKVREILKRIGARYVLVWEYDFALGKNLRSPFTFAYSWFSKFRTILASYGLAGTGRLVRDVLGQKRTSE